ncbi:MAG: hypothetical protein IMF14_08660, partial [Proteobacteria bacterium]|nr:hypothetical protein [Pseudomonadota bacterium]
MVVIYGYMFWGNLTGKDTPAGEAIAYLSSEFESVGTFVSAVKNKQAKLSAERSESETGKSAETAAGNAQQPSPATISYSHNQTPVRQSSADVTAMKTGKPSQSPSPASSDNRSAGMQAGSDKLVASTQQPQIVPVPGEKMAGEAANKFVPEEV